MRQSLCFFISMLFIVALTSACGPSSPGPAQRTPTVAAAVIPTTAQIAQAVQMPTATSTPGAPQATVTPSRGCSPPEGWSPYTVKSGDTVYALAKQVNLTPEELMRSNCLASSLLGVGDTLFLPVESCTPSPPEDWRIYVVRSGDTLFSLASTRDTTVAEVKRVNCLISDSLEVGKQLYLPRLVLPPAPPTQVQPPAPPAPVLTPAPAATVASCSVFGCPPQEALPILQLPPGGPNDSGFKPCSVTKGYPWISVETEGKTDLTGNLDPKRNDLQHGQRAYYYACEFPDPAKLTAQMSGPGGVLTLTVLSAIPNLDLQMRPAQRVVVWNATCDLPTGDNAYTLTMSDTIGSLAQLTFSLKTTSFERILTTPYQSGPAGTPFQIYYCGYGDRAGQEVLVDSYYGVKRTDSEGGYDFHHIDSWNILINATGWTTQTLQSFSGDPARIYLINDREPSLKGYDYVWLTP